jgi:SWI/SNF-related matrix-associated actin-dependent regulator of chromatin subfamily D
MIRKTDLEHMFRKPGPIVPPQQQVPQHYAAHGHMQQAQQRAEQERREKMRRVAMNPTDKNIPDGVEEICIGDGVARYKELREIERTLDSTMMRKKLEMTDSVHHSRARRYGTMRVWISNTVENQPWQKGAPDQEDFDFDNGTAATYKVLIQGRLLDEDEDAGLSDEEEEEEEEEKDEDAMDEDGAESKKKAAAARPKQFSQFLTSITVDFDRAKSLQPDNFTQVRWERPEGGNNPKESNFSELAFERKGDENINVVVNLQRYHHPERYRLSKPLAELLDTDEEDRAGVMMGIWEYARSQHLQQDEDERKFACDAKLKALFNQDAFYFPHIPQLIKPHLTSLPPVQLPYTIRVDKEYNSPPADSGVQASQPTIYDVQVALEDPMQAMVYDLLRPKDAVERLQKIKDIDDQLVLLMGAIAQSKAKHAFFTSMAKDPVSFVNRWLSSQKRDLEVLLGEASRGGDEEATGEEWMRGGPDSVWASDTAKESVALWLAAKNMKGH